jgi:preprotein translocase subunit SecG
MILSLLVKPLNKNRKKTMETIILVIHLIIALAIIGLVLIQRSSGGGLGIGGGGAGEFATAKSTANALTKSTTLLAIAFFITSLTLAWLATNHGKNGVLDALDAEVPVASDVQVPVADPIAPEPSVPVAK